MKKRNQKKCGLENKNKNAKNSQKMKCQLKKKNIKNINQKQNIGKKM